MLERKRISPTEDLEHDPYRFLDEVPPEWEVLEQCRMEYALPSFATEIGGEWFDGSN